MKKFTLFLLAIVFTFACFVSCAKEASEAKHLSAPTDEVAVTKRFYSENEKGLAMEITVSGYASESLNESFYVKNGEEFYVQVTVKNPTDRDIPRLASTMCQFAVDEALGTADKTVCSTDTYIQLRNIDHTEH